MRKGFTYLKSLASLGLFTSLGLLGVVSCGGNDAPPDNTMMMTTPPDGTIPAPTDQPAMAFNHDGTLAPVGDIFADGQQIPVSQSQYMHACGKLSYATLGRILSKRGVPTTVGTQCTDATGSFDCTAGSLYTNGNLVLGVANYPARSPEDSRNSTGGIVRLQDILIGAAEALVVPNTNPDGAFTGGDCAGAKLFNGTTCNADGFACLVGVPLTTAQLNLCNQMVTDSTGPSDPIIAKRLTLSAIAASIYLCD